MIAESIPRYATGVVGLAAAYFVAGKLALLLAIPPGYATAVWPAAGIALAAIVRKGFRYWPGILLGSFCVNVGTSFDASTILTSLSVPAWIGLGAALQGIVGGLLARRFVTFPHPLIRENDILRFLAMGGPLACLVGATWGVGALWVGGVVPGRDVPFHWFTWWVGDTIGVALFAPLILIWVGQAPFTWRGRPLSVTLPLAACFAGLVSLFVFVSSREAARKEVQFQRQVESVFHALEQSFTTHKEVLHSIVGFHDGSTEVTRQDFTAFARRFFEQPRGVQALGWNPLVPHASREAYEAAARQDGLEGFHLTERGAGGKKMIPASLREEYYPAYYIEPMRGNERALGFDLGSEPNRLEAVRAARDSGQQRATAPIVLVQDTGGQIGYLLLEPVYSSANPSPPSVEERRAALKGFAVGVFRLGDVVRAALANIPTKGLAIWVLDESAGPAGALVHGPISALRAASGAGGTARPGQGAAGLEWSISRRMAGRLWTFRFLATPDHPAAERGFEAWAVLTYGLVASSLLGILLLVLTGHSTVVERLVAERTRELERSQLDLQREVAERQRAEEKTTARNRELETLLHVTSHDLREPLRAVDGFSRIVRERYSELLDEKGQDYLARISGGARRLDRLLTDILSLSRAQRLEVPDEEVEGRAIVEEALTRLETKIQETCARVRVPSDLPRFRADRSWATEAVYNLLANALKFTRNGDAPDVEVAPYRENGEVGLIVADRGCGIAPESAERIFQLFQRAVGREVEGTGAGLAIVREVAERHGGRVWVRPREGGGSEFIVTFGGSGTEP